MVIAQPPQPSFAAAHHDIAPGVSLSVLKPYEAAQAGVICASMDPWARYPITAAELTAFLAKPEHGAPRYAIRVAGSLEGVVVVRTNWLFGPYIQTFALAPTVQGRGVGTVVMAFIDAEARRNGARNLWVAASDFNAGAQRFYARHGVTPVADLDDLIRPGKTEVLMRKRLG